MRPASFLLLLLACLAIGPHIHGKERTPNPVIGPETALIIIDIQNFYFEKGAVPLTGPIEAAKQARRVLDAFRAQ